MINGFKFVILSIEVYSLYKYLVAQGDTQKHEWLANFVIAWSVFELIKLFGL